MKSLKILSLPVDRGGCGWYRVRQPFEMIKVNTIHDAHVVSKDDNMLAVAEALSVADIIVVRQGGEVGLPALKSTIDKYGKEIGKNRSIKAKIVLDIDDNMEVTSPYSQHYDEYGIKEFYDNNQKKWVWKDGENNFNLARNRQRIMSLMRVMIEADLVTTTTKHLADYARRFNKNVAVLPNSVNFDKWDKLPFKLNEQLRIGWAGGISHYEDWWTIKEPLNRLLRKHRFKLVSIGTHFPGVIDEDLRDLVEIRPWVPFEAHPYRMMCMNLDIALIPLADLPFNKYKSAIKFIEMSAMGVPSLVSNITPYKEEITDDTAMSYINEQEFEQNLEKLILSAQLREKLGNNALKWARQNYNAAKNAKLWIDAYQSIL